MGLLREQDQLHSSSDFPYQEALLPTDEFVSYKPNQCPKCGSHQHTTYRSIFSERSEKGIISGDLEIKNLYIMKCLNCGAEHPITFDQKREA